MTINLLFYLGEAHIEFCCHLARGNIDPKETPVYEYVKFVGDFKFHNNGKDFAHLIKSVVKMLKSFFELSINIKKMHAHMCLHVPCFL